MQREKIFTLNANEINLEFRGVHQPDVLPTALQSSTCRTIVLVIEYQATFTGKTAETIGEHAVVDYIMSPDVGHYFAILKNGGESVESTPENVKALYDALRRHLVDNPEEYAITRNSIVPIVQYIGSSKDHGFSVIVFGSKPVFEGDVDSQKIKENMTVGDILAVCADPEYKESLGMYRVVMPSDKVLNKLWKSAV